MALARLALKNLQQRGATSASLLSRNVEQKQQGYWGLQILRRLSSGAAEEKADGGHEVTVSEGGKKSRVFPRRRGRRGLWRTDNRDSVPALWESFPSGLGNALMQATENINRLLENLALSQLIGRAKEQDDCYKLRYHVPGLGKDDVKITVDEGVLNIQGEHKEEEEEEEEGFDDEFCSERRYGYYNSRVVLPDDAKVDGIRAELKDGVLNIVIPKSERVKKDVKEIEVQ